jgi:hypothetical protein
MPHGTGCGLGTTCGGNYNSLSAPKDLTRWSATMILSLFCFTEKLEAFARTGSDMLADVSEAIILDNFLAAIRANEVRLRRFAVGGLIDGWTPVV